MASTSRCLKTDEEISNVLHDLLLEEEKEDEPLNDYSDHKEDSVEYQNVSDSEQSAEENGEDDNGNGDDNRRKTQSMIKEWTCVEQCSEEKNR